MFDDKGMLTDRARGILFWFTIGIIAVLAIIVIATLVNLLRGVVSPEETFLVVSPHEISLCSGGQHQFTIEGGAEAQSPKAAFSLSVIPLATIRLRSLGVIRARRLRPPYTSLYARRRRRPCCPLLRHLPRRRRKSSFRHLPTLRAMWARTRVECRSRELRLVRTLALPAWSLTGGWCFSPPREYRRNWSVGLPKVRCCYGFPSTSPSPPRRRRI